MSRGHAIEGRTESPDCPTCSAAQALLTATESLQTYGLTGQAVESQRLALNHANERWDSLPKRRPHTCRWAPKVEDRKPVES